jgi:hypothetical protein
LSISGASAAFARREGGGRRRRKPRRGDHVEPHHRLELVDVGVDERRHGRDACIVHQHGDRLVEPEASLDLGEVDRFVEISLQRLDRDACLGADLGGQRGEPRLVARDQQQIVAPLG